MRTSLSTSQLHQLACQGALNRIAELEAEISAIEAAFKPGKAGKRRGRRRKPGRRGWSPAQRRAAALRMKKYWAARKSAKK
jgi:hypothetical protein